MVEVAGEVVARSERRRRGKALRERCPRASLGAWKAPRRGRDVVALVRQSNRDRAPDLVPVRHGRMLQSPLAFFRGTALLQAHDLAGSPSSGAVVQLCGDAHLLNFGGYATPERIRVFGLNDFDETLPGPWEWDVKRLAASCVVAARSRGFKRGATRELVVDAMRTYRERMAGYAAMRTLDLWYAHITAEDVRHATPAKLRDETARLERRGRARTAAALYPKVTQLADGRIRIEDDPPFLYHLDSRLEAYGRAAHQVFARYRATLPAERRVILDRFQPIDVAAKVVGVGSVGTRCYVILLLAADDDPLFLQMKEAHASVLEPFLGRSKSKNHGERVVFGQRVIQEASDVFLGWTRGPGGRDFYFRQLRDMCVPMDLEETTVDRLANFARLCGWALARAHAKSGDPALLAGYLGSSTAFDEALADYATAYADQVERDFEAFVRAARAGRLASDVDPARR